MSASLHTFALDGCVPAGVVVYVNEFQQQHFIQHDVVRRATLVPLDAVELKLLDFSSGPVTVVIAGLPGFLDGCGLVEQVRDSFFFAAA